MGGSTFDLQTYVIWAQHALDCTELSSLLCFCLHETELRSNQRRTRNLPLSKLGVVVAQKDIWMSQNYLHKS
jgi:hypothetical protein